MKAMSNFSLPLFLSLLLPCCAGNSPRHSTPAPTPVTDAAVHTAESMVDASADTAPPSEETIEAFVQRTNPGVHLYQAIAWPGAGGFSDTIAVFAGFPQSQSTRIEPGISWIRRSESARPADRMPYPLGTAQYQSLETLDLHNDQNHELLLFLRRDAANDDFPSTTLVYTLTSGGIQPNLDVRESAFLDGTNTPAEVRARLPFDRSPTAEELTTLSTSALIARMSYLPIEAFRALSARTVEVCFEVATEPRPHRTCRNHTMARITPRVFTTQFIDAIQTALEATTLLVWECDTPTRCTASRSGGTSIRFIFEGNGAERKLRRIHHHDQNLGE